MRYLLIPLLFVQPLLANFSVTPLFMTFNAPEGEQQTQLVTVTNSSEHEVTVELNVSDFLMQTDGSEVELDPGSEARSCSSWISYAPQGPISIPAGEAAQVRVTMQPAANASGLYWSKLYVKELSKPQTVEEQQGAMNMTIFVRQRWEVRIHQEMPGTLEAAGKLTELAIARTEDKALQFNIGFVNQGNSLLRCEGRVELRDMSGAVVQSLPLGTEGIFHLYPDLTRSVSTQTQTPLSEGDYVALAIIDFGGENLVAGQRPFHIGSPTPVEQ